MFYFSDGISKDDVKVFGAVPTKPGSEFQNVSRWYESISAVLASRFVLHYNYDLQALKFLSSILVASLINEMLVVNNYTTFLI